jgi:hypothetical protein
MKKIIPIVLLAGLLALTCGCLGIPSITNDILDDRSSQYSEGFAITDSDYYYSGQVAEKEVYYEQTAPASSGGVVAGADQMIIKTGHLNLEVKDAQEAAAELQQIADAHKGYVTSLNVYSYGNDRFRASATIRVAADAFDATFSELKDLGTLQSQTISAQDVTEEYIDLQARQTALQNQLAQYNRIMEKAEEVEDILKIQVEIERVQVELDRIAGRMQYLENRVDYATITVDLYEPEPVGAQTGWSIIEVLNDAIEGLLAMIAAIIILFFTLLPLFVIGVIIFLIIRRYRKQKKQGEGGKSDKGDD